MALFTLRGAVEARGPSPANLNVALQMLGLALRERFDDVQVDDCSVEARVSGVLAWTFRGRRTHPMLPYEQVRLQLDGRNPQRLAFTLNFQMQKVSLVFTAVGIGLLASIDSGPAKGLAIGAGFAAALFLLNRLLSRHRAFKWLSTQWAAAVASSGNSSGQRS